MQLLSLISRIFIGSLFVISGLIKLNDPYGTAYKLEEYFEVFALDINPFFHKFIPYSLFFSILISGFEVILGVAILLYYRMKKTMWITLAIILFFTFLTFYSYAFDKVKECGCFGTAIKLSAKQSFYKELVLLVFIGFLFAFRNKLEAGFNNLKGNIIIGLTSVLAFGIGIYTKNYLPIFDPTSYRPGNDLTLLTKPIAKAKYEWILEKNGKEYRFDDEHYPLDTTYKYRRHILLTDSSLLVPKIASFRIYNDDGEFTEEALKGKKIFIIIADAKIAADNCDSDCMAKANTGINFLESRGFKSMILTVPSSGDSFEDYRHEVQLSGDVYYMDNTVLKTMVRSDPGMMLLENGKILKKWSYHNFPDVEYLKYLID